MPALTHIHSWYIEIFVCGSIPSKSFNVKRREREREN